MPKKKSEHNGYYFSIFLFVTLGVLTFWLILPFVNAILAGFIFAWIFFPVYKFVLQFLKAKRVSAILTIAFITIVVLLPLTLIATVIALEIPKFLGELPSMVDFAKLDSTIQQFTGHEISFQQSFAEFSTSLGKTLLSASASIAGQSATAVLKLVIIILLIYFLFTENKEIVAKIRGYLPFTEKNTNYLVKHSAEIIHAILIGQGVSAVLQSIVIWVTFSTLDIPGAAFWAFATLILAFLPVVGATIVWIPAALIMILQGNYQEALAIALVGVLIVSSIENLLKPLLMKGHTTVHAFPFILGIFAGLQTLGIIGIFVGPILIAMFMTVVEIYRRER